MSLEDIKWEDSEIINLRTPYLGDNKILGGGLFQRIITDGMIQWKLAGIYTHINNKWNVKLIQ